MLLPLYFPDKGFSFGGGKPRVAKNGKMIEKAAPGPGQYKGDKIKLSKKNLYKI